MFFLYLLIQVPIEIKNSGSKCVRPSEVCDVQASISETDEPDDDTELICEADFSSCQKV